MQEKNKFYSTVQATLFIDRQDKLDPISEQCYEIFLQQNYDDVSIEDSRIPLAKNTTVPLPIHFIGFIQRSCASLFMKKNTKMIDSMPTGN